MLFAWNKLILAMETISLVDGYHYQTIQSPQEFETQIKLYMYSMQYIDVSIEAGLTEGSMNAIKEEMIGQCQRKGTLVYFVVKLCNHIQMNRYLSQHSLKITYLQSYKEVFR